ncbi:MAG: chemotaxis protein CheB [Gammaproteobacteria bacterium]|nr:chemotaxis protein CheB [Gammaproteobacteria bacterium]
MTERKAHDNKRIQYDTLVIGGSTGAIPGITTILEAIPADVSMAIVIVLHLSADSEIYLTEELLQDYPLPVTVIKDKQTLEASHIYIVPGNYHCYLEANMRFSLSMDEPVHYCRPSIDVFFESVAASLQGHCIAVLLSGANEDGAEGLLALQKTGAYTMAQSVASSVAGEMPMAAQRLHAANFIGAPKQLVEKVLSLI